MERQINAYQGINKDAGYDSIPNTHYVNAVDIRITTTTGESMGSFTNIKGNVESFSIPQIGVGLSEIIGYTTIRDKIILFVADDSGIGGWIYLVKYDPATRIVDTAIYPELLYTAPELNFNKTQPIEAIGRFESECIQRVYWTDYENYLRSINIADPNILTFDPNIIDIFPAVTYQQPLLTAILGSGSLLVGEYQVAYLLRTEDGKETLVSPPSNLIHLTDTSEALVQSAQYRGNIKGTNSGKAIQITIDTSAYVGVFKEMDIISVFHEDLGGTPEVTYIETKDVVGSSLEFTITGNETGSYPIEFFTYTLKNYPFKTCKTLTQKDNSLVVANIKASTFDLQALIPGIFDAKTKRYNYLGNDWNTENPVGPVKTELDLAFNTNYNLDAHWDSDWQVNEQYKYQSDGITLGGEGPNISYKFHLEKFTVDGNNTEVGFANISNIPDYFSHDLQDGYNYNNTTYPNNASPFISGLLRGYKRGETYRFGIIFYNVKGEASFVEYIGDIKFPDISEQDGDINASGSEYWPLSTQSGLDTIAYSMGIEFTFNFPPELVDIVTSYQVVRLKRNIEDTRRLTQGIVKPFWYNPITEPGASMNIDLRVNNSHNVYHLMPVYPQDDGAGYILAFLNPGTFNTLNNSVHGDYQDYLIQPECLGYYSPEISYDFNTVKDVATNFTTAPCLLITGAYNKFDLQIYDDTPDKNLSAIDLSEHCIDKRNIARSTIPVSFNSIENIRKWKTNKYMSMPHSTQYGKNTPECAMTIATDVWLRNYYAADNFSIGGAGMDSDLNNPELNPTTAQGKSIIFKGGSSIIGDIEGITVDPITGIPVPMGPSTNYFNTPNTVVTLDLSKLPDSIPIIDTLTPKLEIYGGFDQSVLETNIFQITSPVIDISQTNPRVFGGDIFLNMVTMQTGTMELATSFYENPTRDYRSNSSRTELYVMESTINIDLAHGTTLKTGVRYLETGVEEVVLRQETNNTDFGYGVGTAMYAYNTVYSRESEDLAFGVSPLDNTNCGGNDIRAYLSKVKINGELIDSWTKFGSNDYYDVDDYGPINKILNWKDLVYFIQDKGVGTYAINPRALTTSTDGVPTQLGAGQGFGKHLYISKEHGSIHQYGVKATNTAIYFFDAIHRKLFSIGVGARGESGLVPLSEKGIHSFLQTLPEAVFSRKADGGDNPILRKGISIGRDKINDEILFTFLGTGIARTLELETTYLVGEIVLVYITGVYYIVTNEFTTGEDPFTAIGQLVANSDKLSDLTSPYNSTIVYDELLSEFSSMYSATPQIWIDNGDILMTPGPINSGGDLNVYTHNIGNWGEFYGDIKEASITLVINPNADINKVLRTLEYNSIVRDNNKIVDRAATITAFRIQNQTQDTGIIPFSSGRIKRKFDKWRVKIPRDITTTSQKGRLRSSYFVITLYFDNTSNKELIMNKLMSYYDVQMF
jgi:hypothetical protein